MARKDKHSVFNEPTQGGGAESREHSIVGEPSVGYVSKPDDEHHRIRHNVWDDPANQWNAHAKPEHLENYAEWYARKDASTGLAMALLATAGIALLGGPLAVLGSMISTMAAGVSSYVSIIVVGPLVEELMKVALVVIALETRPYWFKSSTQIMLGVLLSALAFAVIENIIYLNVYVPEPSQALVVWRWTVCVALHVSATAVAGAGAMRMWHLSRRDWSAPKIHHGYPFFVAATVLHGAYNLFAVMYSTVLEPF